MKKKALALAMAGILATPAALAARDPDGMSYTSTSEGLTGNVESRYNSSGGNENNEGDLHFRGDFSVNGTIEIQPGLTGFYNLGIRDDTAFDTATQTGLRGSFGSVAFGNTDGGVETFIVNSTDIANSNSGDYDEDITGTDDYYVLYQTPDFNGFQLALEGKFQNTSATTNLSTLTVPSSSISNPVAAGTAGVWTPAAATAVQPAQPSAINLNRTSGAIGSTLTPNSATRDQNTLDFWGIAAKYNIAGFTASAGYTVETDGLAAYSANRYVSGASASGAPITGATAAGNYYVHVDRNNDGLVQFNTAAATSEIYQVTTANNTEAKGVDDRAAWVLGLAYSQDNWSVAGWYAERENQNKNVTAGVVNAPVSTADNPNNITVTSGTVVLANEDSEYLSLAGSVDIDRVKLYAVYNSVDNVAGRTNVDDSTATLGVQYNLSAQTRAWIEYITNDKDSVNTEEDWVQIALKYDF